MASGSGKTLAGGKVAPNNSNAAAMQTAHGSMPAGSPSIKGVRGSAKPLGNGASQKMQPANVVKTGGYPTPAKGGGKVGTSNTPGTVYGGPAGKPHSHPRSRKPMVR